MVLGGNTLGDSSPFLSFSASTLEFRASYIDAPVVLNFAPPKTYENAYKHERIHAHVEEKYPLPECQLKRLFSGFVYFEATFGFAIII